MPASASIRASTSAKRPSRAASNRPTWLLANPSGRPGRCSRGWRRHCASQTCPAAAAVGKDHDCAELTHDRPGCGCGRSAGHSSELSHVRRQIIELNAASKTSMERAVKHGLKNAPNRSEHQRRLGPAKSKVVTDDDGNVTEWRSTLRSASSSTEHLRGGCAGAACARQCAHDRHPRRDPAPPSMPVRRGPWPPASRPHRDDRGHGGRWPAIGAHRAAEGARRARLRVLYPPRRTQGPRTAGQPAGGAAVPLAARCARACNFGSRARSRSSPTPGGGCLFRQPPRAATRSVPGASHQSETLDGRETASSASSISSAHSKAARCRVRRAGRVPRCAAQRRILVRRAIPPARALAVRMR